MVPVCLLSPQYIAGVGANRDEVYKRKRKDTGTFQTMAFAILRGFLWTKFHFRLYPPIPAPPIYPFYNVTMMKVSCNVHALWLTEKKKVSLMMSLKRHVQCSHAKKLNTLSLDGELNTGYVAFWWQEAATLNGDSCLSWCPAGQRKTLKQKSCLKPNLDL